MDRRLLRTVAAARRFVALVAIIGLASALLLIAQAGLLAEVISAAFLGGARLDALAPALALLLGVVLARAVLAWATEVAAHRAAASVIAQLRQRLLDHVLRLGPRHPELLASGQLAALATRGVDALDGYVSRFLPQLLVAAVVPLVIGIRILTLDWVSALLIGITVPLIPLFMVLIGLHTKQRMARQWRALALLGHHFLDVVSGLDVLTAFGRARVQGRRIAEMSEHYRVATMRGLRVAFLSALTLELLATLSVALVAVSVGLRLVEGRLDLATGLLVIVLAPEVYQPLRAVAARFHDSAEGAGAADEIFAVLDVAPDEPEYARADPLGGPPRLRAVHVAGRSGPVLENLSIDIAPGEVLGLTGPSGAGKSTVLDLLLGWRRPDRGRVCVGDVEVADMDRDAWLGQVAWVPQHPLLVRGSVADNLRLAAPDATDEQLARVAGIAALDVPLATQVHERGQGLSTGQQRRVALARALLADRPLMLLDEPTEGIDADTEAALLAALPAALAGRTVVVVSHRPSVLTLCDRVVSLPGHIGLAAPPQDGGAEVTDSTETESDTWVGDPVHDSPGHRRLGPLFAAARPHLGGSAVAALAGGGALGCSVALTAVSAWLISSAALHPPVLALMLAIVGVRAFGLAKGVLRYLERLASHDAALRVLATLRVRLWEALVRLGPAATGRLRAGDLLARLIRDVDAQQDVLVRALVPAAAAAVAGLVAAIGLGVLLPSAGVALAVGLICAGLVAPALTVRFARRAIARTAAARGALAGALVELLEARAELLAFGAAARRRQAVSELDAQLTALHRRAATATGLGAGLTVLAIGATSIGCTALGVTALRAGTLPGPFLAVLALTPLALVDVVAPLPDAARQLATALPSTRRLAALAGAPPPVSEPDRPRPAPPGRVLGTRELSVRWPGAESPAVSGVRLDVPAGQRLVLAGPSGSGKTTVLAAIMRTLDPCAGSVLIDGMDTRHMLGDDVRSRIAWCGPTTHLFDSSLRQNLLLACPRAQDRELVDALRRAGLGGWLAHLPEGLATRVGHHGDAVSGGERQRIALARALLANRPALLLDEPTAHLDAATAARVSADLLTATEGRTTIVVTHRPDELPGVPRVLLSPQPLS